MGDTKQPRAGATALVFAVAGIAAAVSGCTTSEPTTALKSSTKEHFSEAAYGVKASPRVTTEASNLPRGGGDYKIGSPYKVAGKWYKPELDPDYSKVGAASWYGDAFHGRLTANGEVYDMTHLTAAHPTMPLPSYARVTNLKNGSSVVVRVNDRGPYASGRIIDLSKRAAQLLDYTHDGVAKVEVDYVGPAALDGQDDQYLMASYQPGDDEAAPDSGMPGVMVAMNSATPTSSDSAVGAAFDGRFGDPDSDTVLPATGPIVPDRPETGIRQAKADRPTGDTVALGYADSRIDRASGAFDAILNETPNKTMTAGDVRRSWERTKDAAANDSGEYIAVGSWKSRETAERYAHRLSALGRVELDTGAGRYQLNLYPQGEGAIDGALQAAWAAGAGDALVVRD